MYPSPLSVLRPLELKITVRRKNDKGLKTSTRMTQKRRISFISFQLGHLSSDFSLPLPLLLMFRDLKTNKISLEYILLCFRMPFNDVIVCWVLLNASFPIKKNERVNNWFSLFNYTTTLWMRDIKGT